MRAIPKALRARCVKWGARWAMNSPDQSSTKPSTKSRVAETWATTATATWNRGNRTNLYTRSIESIWSWRTGNVQRLTRNESPPARLNSVPKDDLAAAALPTSATSQTISAVTQREETTAPRHGETRASRHEQKPMPPTQGRSTEV